MEPSDDKVVILDTSMILAVFENFIDLEGNLIDLIGKYKVIIPSSVLRELRGLAYYGKGKKRVNAKSALEYIKRFEIMESKERGVDESILNLAKKFKAVVATNDKELRRKLRRESLPVIYLRGRKKLSMDGII